MTVVTEVAVDADAFVLDHALQEAPGMYVEGERMVTHSDEWVLPLLSATGGSFDAFERAIEEDETVAEWTRVDAFEGINRYRFDWDEQSQEGIRDVLDRDGMVLAAAAMEDTWRLEIQFTDRGQLADLQASFDDEEGAVSLERLCEPDHPGERAYRLTPEQRKTLLLAHEMGFFSVPRETTVEELADHLDISPGAVSERLRRGSDTLVGNTLAYERR